MQRRSGTWCHCSPGEPPTRLCHIITISVKVNLDAVAGAGDGGRQGGADVLASSKDQMTESKRIAAGLLHQGRSVGVLDCHVVVGARGIELNSKCRELDCNNQSLLDFDDIHLPQIMRIVARVVW